MALRLIRNQAGLGHLQIIVFGEIDGEIPGHGLDLAQLRIDDHALDPIDHRGNAPGRVGQVLPGCGPPGRNGLITPHKLSAQSLGRKVLPSRVMP